MRHSDGEARTEAILYRSYLSIRIRYSSHMNDSICSFESFKCRFIVVCRVGDPHFGILDIRVLLLFCSVDLDGVMTLF